MGIETPQPSEQSDNVVEMVPSDVEMQAAEALSKFLEDHGHDEDIAGQDLIEVIDVLVNKLSDEGNHNRHIADVLGRMAMEEQAALDYARNRKALGLAA